MEFQKERCFTALNAEELKVGSKVLVSNCVSDLKKQVAIYENGDTTRELVNIRPESSYDGRFETIGHIYHFAYLISEPEEKKLKWTDLKLGDVITNGLRIAMVTEIDKDDCLHIYAGHDWFNDASLTGWVKVEE